MELRKDEDISVLKAKEKWISKQNQTNRVMLMELKFTSPTLTCHFHQISKWVIISESVIMPLRVFDCL